MVVIIGAGVVGAATAYYLSAASGAGAGAGKTITITILDAVGPAAGSSGKAGAFITNRPPAFRRGIGIDNNDNKAVNDKRKALFETSFELHQQLAKDLELESFCRVQNYQTIETSTSETTTTTNNNGAGDDDDDDDTADGTRQQIIEEDKSSDHDKSSPNKNKNGSNNNIQQPPSTRSLTELAENGGGEPLPGDAALVDPTELTLAMLDKAMSSSSQISNCSFRQANVAGLETDASGRRVTAIHLEGDCDIDGREDEHNRPSSSSTSQPQPQPQRQSQSQIIEIDEDEPVVIALGPWSCRIEDWLGIPMPIEGVASTSLIYQDGISASADVGTALFFDEDSNGCHLEVFGRQDKSLYVSGCGESEVISTRVLRSNERPSPAVPCAPDVARAAAAQASLTKADIIAIVVVILLLLLLLPLLLLPPLVVVNSPT